MSNSIITIENIGKRYRLFHKQGRPRYKALRDVIADKFKSIFNIQTQETDTSDASSTEDFWALKNICFEVKQGEVVGIIGRNGAGKSTLLKILSRITEPSEGRLHLRGRVASLLEVGTGFHPELTGRENIFLNGAILGMSQFEIRKKFDEIVAFAEVEKFLDTSVKHYSTGMYVRLAFAVAAHLEPEILIVDEVLSVGDAQFQKKCMGKMQSVAREEGRTVLFVSHNMAAVQALCSYGFLLDQGRLIFQGSPEEIVGRYLHPDAISIPKFKCLNLSKDIVLKHLEANPPCICSNDSIDFIVELQVFKKEIITDLMLEIYSLSGQLVAIIDLRSEAGPYRLNLGETLVLSSNVDKIPFIESDFNLALYINSTSVCCSFTNLIVFSVLPAGCIEGVLPREARFRGLVELKKTVKSKIIK